MDADTLRLILIVAGGLLLAGLYLWERRRARSDQDEDFEAQDFRRERLDKDEREPKLGAWGSDQGDASGGVAVGTEAREPSEPFGEPEQTELHLQAPVSPAQGSGRESTKGPLLLCFHITPKEGILDGEAIVHAASRCGVEPGEMDVFYRYSDEPGTSKQTLFTMANMVKPGTFPFGGMAEFESPGLTLFSRAEGAADDLLRLEVMLETTHCLADALKAEVRDETRALLTPQIEERLRERVLDLVTRRFGDPDQK
jgi:cell division protein ZipA